MEYYQNQSAGTQYTMPVKDNKVLAIVTLVISIFCCNPISIVLAIIAVLKACDVRKLEMMGQRELAERSGSQAGVLSWIALGVMFIGYIIYFVWVFALGGMAVLQEMMLNMH